MLTWDVLVLNGYLLINLHVVGYIIYQRWLGREPNPKWYLPFVFLAIGYGTKAGLVPLHSWLPDAEAEGPLPISAVTVDLTPDPADNAIDIEATVRTTGRTGVEMEALTAVQVGLLTVYDMCKAADRGMVMDGIRVLEKHGGKSGDWVAP